MSLFHRIKSPFSESAEEETLAPEWPVHAVGDMLRERREELGLDLETAGAALRIKPVYLAALEQGRPHDLPGPTYAVGFIRAYAHYLGFDGAWMLDRYKAEATEVHLRPDLSLPVPLSERSLPGGPILLVAAILALCGYGTWYYLSTGERARPERVAAVPAELHPIAKAPIAASDHAAIKPGSPGTAAIVAASGAGTANPASARAEVQAADGAARLAAGLTAPNAAPPPHQNDGSGNATEQTAGGAAAGAGVTRITVAAGSPPDGRIVPTSAAPAAATANDGAATPAEQIELRALADCWIQLRTANQTIVFSRVLKAGETYRVPRSGLVMRVGNAGALAIAVDGKLAPPIGPAGMLRRDVVLDPEALLAGTAVKG